MQRGGGATKAVVSRAKERRRDGERIELEAKWLMNEGADVGQSAAEAFVQWSKQEHELDSMTRSWERALELESPDSEESSDDAEKRSHQDRLMRINHHHHHRKLAQPDVRPRSSRVNTPRILRRDALKGRIPRSLRAQAPRILRRDAKRRRESTRTDCYPRSLMVQHCLKSTPRILRSSE